MDSSPAGARSPRGGVAEVRLVLGLIAALTAAVFPRYQRAQAAAARGEALIALAGVRAAQQSFYRAQGRYAADFEALGWDYLAGARDELRGERYTLLLTSGPGGGYRCTAAGQLDDDAWLDLLQQDERGPPVLVYDDLHDTRAERELAP